MRILDLFMVVMMCMRMDLDTYVLNELGSRDSGISRYGSSCR